MKHICATLLLLCVNPMQELDRVFIDENIPQPFTRNSISQDNYNGLITAIFYPEKYTNLNDSFNNNPSFTVDGLRMSEKKMFFSSDKAKKKLHYRPRPAKDAIKDSVEWIVKNF